MFNFPGISRREWLALCLALSCVTPLQADNRALLIGMGHYKDTSVDLGGIDIDLDLMREMARKLGYRDNQIKVLKDREVTLSHLESTFDTWLKQGTSAGDRVLIYYTGHGSQIPDENGDEEDGLDEVLTMYDVRPQRRQDRDSLEGVLVDDRFSQLLASLPNRDILVLVDACHSGTSTKSFEITPESLAFGKLQDKFYSYPGMPGNNGLAANFQSKGATMDLDTGTNYIALTAARDNEKSLASAKGSLFTHGLHKAVLEAGSDLSHITPEYLKQQAEAFVEQNVPPLKRFHPQMSGNSALATKLLVLETPTVTNWRQLERVADQFGTLPVHTNQTRFRLGERLEISVEVPKAGYLNLINVDGRDKPIILFPNPWQKESRVPAGTFQVPGHMDFELPASPPLGKNLIVALWSEIPLNLYQESGGKDTLAILSALGQDRVHKDFAPKARTTPERARHAAGKRVVEIIP